MTSHRLDRLFWRSALAALLLALIACGARAAAPSAVRQLALGHGHSCALTENGALWCWGANDRGQVGNGAAGADVAAPYRVFDAGVAQVSAGREHTCAIVRGALYCWGRNDLGQVGNGQSGEGDKVTAPQRVIDRGVTFVVASRNEIARTCAVVEGALRCWGMNLSGELGPNGVRNYLSSPVTLIDANVSAADIGVSQLCAIVGGALRCWGEANTGPAQAREMLPAGVTEVVVGTNHACAIAQAALYCWGEDRQGGLGFDAPNKYAAKPTPVSLPAEVRAIALDNSVDSSNQHTCALVRGALWCWGNNYAGEIDPDRPRTEQRQPFRVLADGVDALWESPSGERCLRIGGALRCRARGSNAHGELLVARSARTDTLRWDVALGDIDSIDGATVDRLTAAADAELERSASLAAAALEGRLVADSDNVFQARDVRVVRQDRVFAIDFDAVPLLRIQRRNPVRDAQQNVIAYSVTTLPGSACGVTTHQPGDPDAKPPPQLFVRDGERFAMPRVALRNVAPLLPLMFDYWYADDGDTAVPDAPFDAAPEFERIDACAQEIAAQRRNAPYADIELQDAEGNTQHVGARAGGVWRSTTLHDATQVRISTKPGVADSDFALEAQTIGAPLCDAFAARDFRRASRPWKLARDGTRFTLDADTREQLEREQPAVPPLGLPDVVTLLEHAHLNPDDAASLLPRCAPVRWGRRFTLRYRGAVVAQLDVPNATAEPYGENVPPDSAKYLANRMQLTPAPQYAAAKPWPGDATRTILAYAGTRDDPNADAGAQYDLGIVVLETASGKVLEQHVEPAAITSDAMHFDGLELDTANYAVRRGVRAIGVRVAYGHVGYTSSELSTLRLYVPQGTDLEPILPPLVMTSAAADRDCSEAHELTRTLAIAPTSTHGYADLVLDETDQRHELDKTASADAAADCAQNTSTVRARHVLKFDGTRYVVPPELGY